MFNFKWKHRYTTIAIVFVVWFLSMTDRMVMATALPYIAKDFGLSPMAMGSVLSAFFFGYFLFQIPGGMLADKFGARNVLSAAVVFWSICTFLTGTAGSLVSLIAIRVLFGVGEGTAPAATWKVIANWVPMKERGIANGIMMASNSLGPAVAPLLVVMFMSAWGMAQRFFRADYSRPFSCFMD